MHGQPVAECLKSLVIKIKEDIKGLWLLVKAPWGQVKGSLIFYQGDAGNPLPSA